MERTLDFENRMAINLTPCFLAVWSWTTHCPGLLLLRL